MAPHATYTDRIRQGITSQASTGGVLLSSCGNDVPYDHIFDDIVLDAAQVTNPSIDPLREQVETRTYVGPPVREDVPVWRRLRRPSDGSGPIVAMDMPLMLGHISLGRGQLQHPEIAVHGRQGAQYPGRFRRGRPARRLLPVRRSSSTARSPPGGSASPPST